MGAESLNEILGDRMIFEEKRFCAEKRKMGLLGNNAVFKVKKEIKFLNAKLEFQEEKNIKLIKGKVNVASTTHARTHIQTHTHTHIQRHSLC